MSEKFLSASLIFISIWLVILVNQQIPYYSFFNSPLLFASIGASAILVFAVPHGRLSQPWPVLGSHLIASTVAISCVKFIPDLALAVCLSAAISALLMYLLRCLHPPGGGTAVAVVLIPGITDIGYQYVLNPVFTNSLILIGSGILLNNLIPNRYYPYSLYVPEKLPLKSKQGGTPSLSQEDISEALHKLGIYVDITKKELQQIFNMATLTSQQKKMSAVCCKDIMTTPVITAEYGDDVEEVWKLLGHHKIRAIPIIEKNKTILGIITIAGFLNQLSPDKEHTLSYHLKKFIKKSEGNETDKLEYAGHLMTTNIITLNEEQPVKDALFIAMNKHIRHIPIVDQENKLVGMITSRNLFSALSGELEQEHLNNNRP